MSAAPGGGSRDAHVTMETPLGRVRGLGPAGEGAHHWRLERTTSVATLLLLVWLAVSLLRLPALDHATLVEWLSEPLGAVPMLLLIVATFWHSRLGLRVVVEDYVHEEGNKFFSLLLIDFVAILGGALAVFALLKIAFTGSAE
jgi:succinate dehydrogenase / fumarate reductase membrane anchor subunit